ncbi:transcriptional repressor [Caulobacter hibisci]|uniref:Transcriptional repressor n=1 Tax=Caulobacter hibisci TaxID=2035993 RepID=A0ABS0T2H1_9CAUL|nr:transcriptional repressor [Caulobacter hibisci]MBI1685681.1 transcriptional repressor [Caulobacter hibisci]
MPHAVDAVLQDALRRAGLPCRGAAPRLLALLRASEETHLTAPEIADLAAEAGLSLAPADLARQLEAFADHGLVSRLPTTGGEPVFDTQPEPHFHLVYEETARIVDLHVSPETLLAMLRDALARRPGGVEVMVVFRREEDGPAS